jgi:hypothetical protein
MAYDYVDAIPARQAQYAAYDGTYSALYDDLLRTCSNPRFVLTSVAGHDVTPICMPPIRTGPTGPVTPPKDTGTKATATPDMNRRAGESRLITDPNDIRRFIEENRRSDPNGIVKVQGAALTSQNGGQAARTPSGNSVNVNRREGDASQFHNAPKPATVDRPAVIDHSAAQQTHLTAPTPVAQPAQGAPHVSAAPSGSAPVKP